MAKHNHDWRRYQEDVAQFFRDQGNTVMVEADIQGVRAKHEIDVWVTFSRHGIECKWAIECKLWNRRVPKEKILALKSIVDDVGADRGLIISERGFQSGAKDAARDTNITLISSLEDFKQTARTELHPSTLTVASTQPSPQAQLYCFPAGTEPHSLLSYNQILWVANWAGSNISHVDPASKRVLDVIELDHYEVVRQDSKREIGQYPPGSMAVADGKLFVGQVFSEFVLAIDIETRAIVKRLAVPGGGEGQLAASPDGSTIYFASNQVPQFSIIDSATYAMKTIPYPGNGRGCLSLLAHPDGSRLYIGIQRGGQRNGKSYPGGNAFLATYDLRSQQYDPDIYLAEVVEGRSDDSAPICITYDERYARLYVGMFQSRQGIIRIDANTNRRLPSIRFRTNSLNPHFPWVDALAQALYGAFLLSVNRNNRELAILERSDGTLLQTIQLGDAPNGPKDLVVFDDTAIISYPKRNGLVFVDLSALLGA